MGITRASLILSNIARPDLEPIHVGAMADTGALHLCITEHIAKQLMLEVADQREVTLADGSRKVVPYVEGVRVQFANRKASVGAVVIGDEVLLGAIPMEDLDLIVQPATQQVLVDPASPNIAASMAKGLQPGE